MASLEADFKKLQSQWKAICATTHKKIASFFDTHKKDILSSGRPWFMYALIEHHHIDSMKYVFQQCDAQRYTNLMGLHYISQRGTLEMARLVVSIGIDNIKPDHSYVDAGNLIGNLIGNNSIPADEMYLFVEYILTNINDDISKHNIMYALARSTKKSWDPIKILKIIEAKTTLTGSNSSPSQAINTAVQSKNFTFVQYLIDEYDVTISPRAYCIYKHGHLSTDKDIIEWLSKHNVDINGYISKSNKITPLFHCCIEKKYDAIECLLDYGADLHTKCIYKEETLTPFKFCETTFENQYFEYFKNYKAKNIDKEPSKLLGMDLSAIPKTAYDEQEILLNNVENTASLNQLNNEYTKQQAEIAKLEKELQIKYKTLQSLIKQKYELESKAENVCKWIKGQKVWIKFLNEWKHWNIFCFIEYLQRIKYAEKSYNEYYVNDNECKQKVESYLNKHYAVDETKEGHDNETDNNVHFDGNCLVKFTRASIKDIGITHTNDIESVHASIQKLIENDNEDDGKERQNVNANRMNDNHQGGVLEAFLDKINLTGYLDIFKREGYETLDDLKYVTEDDLKKIGITKQAHISRILRGCKQL
eukprot:275796_1